jgi:hypothetical protein
MIVTSEAGIAIRTRFAKIIDDSQNPMPGNGRSYPPTGLQLCFIGCGVGICGLFVLAAPENVATTSRQLCRRL